MVFFVSVSSLYKKKLGRSSYDVNMTYYDVIPILLDLELMPKVYSGTIFLF